MFNVYRIVYLGKHPVVRVLRADTDRYKDMPIGRRPQVVALNVEAKTWQQARRAALDQAGYCRWCVYPKALCQCARADC